MKLSFLKQGAVGKVTIRESRTIAGGASEVVRNTSMKFTVDEVRTKDFIIRHGENPPKLMYCLLPTNKKDGTQSFTLSPNGYGFKRVYIDTFTDSRGEVVTRTETNYQFSK